MPFVKKEVYLETKPGEVFVDDFESIPREEWVYAEVPAETLMGDPFPTVTINQHSWKAGGRYLVPPKYKEHIDILVAGHQRQAVRRLQPKKDIEALLQHSTNRSSAVQELPS